jgi:predicted Zn-dependent protease
MTVKVSRLLLICCLAAILHVRGSAQTKTAQPDVLLVTIDTLRADYAGQALEKTHDLAGARDVLEASLKLMPGQFQARLLLGQVYLALKNPQAAEDQMEAALLLHPNSVEAQLGVSASQIAAGRFGDALPGLLKLSKSNPNNLEVFRLLAQAYRGLNQTFEAGRAESTARRLERPH